MKPRRSRLRWLKKLLLGLVVALAVLAGAFFVYVQMDYDASEEATAAMASGPAVTVTKHPGGCTVFSPQQAQRGLIFYPGGLVATEAYAPLMQRLAQDGTLCILLDPPCELAILRPDQADGIQAAFPEIAHWFIGGHSLGGYVAAGYAAKHPDTFDGVLLLAAYTGADLTNSGLRAACVYGTADGVMNQGRYEAGRSLLPQETEELVIEGGCHSYFGSYGMQKGDGTPTISREEQLEQTAAAFLRLAGE